MSKAPLHEWNLTPESAVALQHELAKAILREDRLGEVHHVAGVDMAINENNGMARAAVVLLTYPALQVVEQHVYEEPVRMPYIPGLLSFREAPCVLGAFAQLKQRPDLVMVDGAGIAHPRRIGIASHLGLWLDLPTIGCAKSILTGTYNKTALSEQAGSWVPIVYRKEVIGAAVRTRTRVNPMIISLGHRISLETSIHYVLACCRGYRLPEPTRQADKLSKNNEWQEPDRTS
ncbi:MAG TPA: deoxyribonuclease V [Ktedonobacteraceae bacterium]|jgi:deoxyribonuclease V|nr:deoxyribonuclease V [Ktedonobacteraceae bacterium]